MDGLISRIYRTDFFAAAQRMFYSNPKNADFDLIMVERDELVIIACVNMDGEFPETIGIVAIHPGTGDLLSKHSGEVLGNLLENWSDEVIAKCGFKSTY